MDKQTLREKCIRMRSEISRREQKDKRIFSAVTAFAASYEKIFVYVSFGCEADTHKLIAAWKDEGKTVYVPFTTPQKEMHAVLPVEPVDLSATDTWGNVPSDTSRFFDGQAEIVIVPLLGFDSDCHRLGYGAGCYDRYFAAYPQGIKTGIAYEEQYCPFPHEQTDLPLDIIITPNRVIRRKP